MFEIFWKCFEFIDYSFLFNSTCVSTMSLYTPVLAIKTGFVLHICI